MRIGINSLVEEFARNRRAIIIAPTGYGKTVASPLILRIAREKEIAYGLIHVVPLRALVREIYKDKFKNLEFKVGYQSMDYLDEMDKSPYFLRELVVTTLDSYVFNIFKVPIAEAIKIFKTVSQGHWYPVLMSILTSVTVFDEAHIYTGDVDESISLELIYAVLKFLTDINLPFVIETATMSSNILINILDITTGGNYSTLPIIYVGKENLQVKRFKEKGIRVNIIEDHEFDEKHSFSWTTKIVNEAEAIKLAGDICNSEVVIIIRNTVRKAIKTFDELSNKCTDIVLIHGSLSNKDRKNAEQRLEEIVNNGTGAIVATQVVEAGIECNARIMITDSAPISNIVQRAGRLCREKYEGTFKECHNNGAEVYIIKPDRERKGKIDVYQAKRVRYAYDLIKKTIETGKSINWRLLHGLEKERSFADLMENEPHIQIKHPISSIKTHILLKYLKSDAIPWLLLDSLGIVPIIRKASMIRIAFNVSNNSTVKKFDDVEYVVVSFEKLISYEAKRIGKGDTCLLYDSEDRVLAVIATPQKNNWILRISPLRKLTKNYIVNFEKQYKKVINAKMLYKLLEVEDYKEMGTIVFLLGNPKCYEKRRGLKTWSR